MAKLGFIFWNHGAKIRHGTHRTGAEHVVRALGALENPESPMYSRIVGNWQRRLVSSRCRYVWRRTCQTV
jgi:hypothetical protein